MDQYERVRQVSGVDVAAPIAMIGYVTAFGFVDVDVTEAVDRTLVRQLVRVNPTWSAARGLTVLDNDAPQYVYVTQRPVVWPIVGDIWEYQYSDGRSRPEMAEVCDGTIFPLEIQEDGRELPLCQIDQSGLAGPLGSGDEQRSILSVAGLRPDGRFATWYRDGDEVSSDRLTKRLRWPLSLLAAAIDPAPEANLVGLAEAVTSGRFLTTEDRSVPTAHDGLNVPVLTTTSPFLDERLTTTVERLSGPAADRVPGLDWGNTRPVLESTLGTPVSADGAYTAADAYHNILADAPSRDGQIARMFPIVQAGDPTYTAAADGTLTPQPCPSIPMSLSTRPYVGSRRRGSRPTVASDRCTRPSGTTGRAPSLSRSRSAPSTR
jgi:hypothetical protein